MDKYKHIAEANRLTKLASSDPENMGRIAMYLAANNHLLWALLAERGITVTSPIVGAPIPDGQVVPVDDVVTGSA